MNVAHSLCLQTWITVAGGANQTVRMTNEKCADLTAFADVALYVEISSITGAGATLSLQTSPNREDAYFATMLEATAGTATTYTTSGMQSILYVRFAATAPARFIRWTAVGTAAWTISFRVWLSCNQARGAASYMPRPGEGHYDRMIGAAGAFDSRRSPLQLAAMDALATRPQFDADALESRLQATGITLPAGRAVRR